VPTFNISIVNETFESSNTHEGHSAEEATAYALKGAFQIGIDEIVDGKPFFAAEVTIEGADKVLSRYVVSLGASRLRSN
jgi:hypothetical protein